MALIPSQLTRTLRVMLLTLRVALLWAWYLLSGWKRHLLDQVVDPVSGPVLFISLYEWSVVRHRPHHLALRLAPQRLVVYFRPFFVRDGLAEGRRLHPPRLMRVERGLYVLEAWFFSGEDQVGVIARLNRALMRVLVRALRPLFAGGDGLVITNDPKRWSVLDAVPARRRVYDILDNYSAFSWATTAYPEHERRTLDLVDLVVAGTHEIYREKLPLHPHVEFQSCGVDAAHFGLAHESGYEPAAAVRELPSPQLFYMGMVDERIDRALIAALAKAFPEGSIVLAGPVVGDFGALRALPNVHLLGGQPYGELPRLLCKADVALIPFILNDVTRHINPTKLLEYLAAGVPVVSIPIPDVVSFYSEEVFIAGSIEEFVSCVRRALGPEGTAKAEFGVARAAQFSWETFTRQFLDWAERDGESS